MDTHGEKAPRCWPRVVKTTNQAKESPKHQQTKRNKSTTQMCPNDHCPCNRKRIFFTAVLLWSNAFTRFVKFERHCGSVKLAIKLPRGFHGQKFCPCSLKNISQLVQIFLFHGFDSDLVLVLSVAKKNLVHEDYCDDTRFQIYVSPMCHPHHKNYVFCSMLLG